ncbi:MAG: MarR family transcriptional regulator [Lachnospiraceae bacterium]|nr:MarR family transcriptional regulator [Lachnospiraceae bacterium]
MSDKIICGYNPDEALKLDNQLCFPLYAAARRIVNEYTPLLKPLGLTYTQYIAFMVLWEKDDITVGEMGQRLHLDNGTITPLLKKLEKDGYIVRERSAEDERVVKIKLTSKGKKMKEKAAEIPLKIGTCVDLTPEEGAKLYELLYKIVNM